MILSLVAGVGESFVCIRSWAMVPREDGGYLGWQLLQCPGLPSWDLGLHLLRAPRAAWCQRICFPSMTKGQREDVAGSSGHSLGCVPARGTGRAVAGPCSSSSRAVPGLGTVRALISAGLGLRVPGRAGAGAASAALRRGSLSAAAHPFLPHLSSRHPALGNTTFPTNPEDKLLFKVSRSPAGASPAREQPPLAAPFLPPAAAAAGGSSSMSERY